MVMPQLDAAGSEFGNNFGARHLLETASARGGEIERAAAEDYHTFITIRPIGKSQKKQTPGSTS